MWGPCHVTKMEAIVFWYLRHVYSHPLTKLFLIPRVNGKWSLAILWIGPKLKNGFSN